VPFGTFLITMLGVHFLVGVVEGLITVAVLAYLQQVRPDIVQDALQGKVRLSKKMVMVTFIIFTILIGAGLSLLASEFPDGLEWSYAARPDEPEFKTAVENKDSKIAAVDDFQSKYSVLPDYTVRGSELGKLNAEAESSSGWTSFAGVTGAGITMAVIWFSAYLLRKRKTEVA
jgi:cobalt/nickel transport system permease protein